MGNPYIEDIRIKVKCYLWTDPKTGIKYQIFANNRDLIQDALIQRGILMSKLSTRKFTETFVGVKKQSLPIGYEGRMVIIHYLNSIQQILADGYKLIGNS